MHHIRDIPNFLFFAFLNIVDLFSMEKILIIAVVLLVIILLLSRREYYIGGGAGYALGPSWNTTDSTIDRGGVYVIGRWRPAPPVLPGARQISDDAWDRAYRPNMGFFLA